MSLMIRKEKVIQISAAEASWNESDPSSAESPTNFTSSVYSRVSELCDVKENLLAVSHCLAPSFSVGIYTSRWGTFHESAPLTSFCHQCLHSPAHCGHRTFWFAASRLFCLCLMWAVKCATRSSMDPSKIAGSKLRLTYYKSLPHSTICCV